MSDKFVDGYKEEAEQILMGQRMRHEAGVCECTENDFCRYASWANGIIPSKHIVQDYHYRIDKKNRTKTEESVD